MPWRSLGVAACLFLAVSAAHAAGKDGALTTQAEVNALVGKPPAVVVIDTEDRIDLRRVPLAPGSRVRADLSNADLSGADLRGVDLVSADLRKAKLDGARLDGAVLPNDLLDGASLRGASLRGARSGECTLSMVGEGCAFMTDEPVDLSGADLTDADLSRLISIADAQLAGATLDGTVLFVDDLGKALGATVRTVVAEPTQFRRGTRTILTGAEIERLRAAGFVPDPWAGAASTHQPSFDCAKAATPTEKAICKDPELGVLDRAMAEAWRLAGKPPQRDFLARRNACGDDAPCILSAYRARVQALTPRLRELGADLPAGEAVYEARAFVLPEPLRADPLMQRFASAMGRDASTVELKRGRDGAPAIEAYVMGSNGHLCSYMASRFDPARGLWHDPEEEAEKTRDGLLVLPSLAMMVEPESPISYYCGARASWPPAFTR